MEQRCWELQLEIERRRRDVLVLPEDVVRVELALQLAQASELLGAEGSLDALGRRSIEAANSRAQAVCSASSSGDSHTEMPLTLNAA
jgi:hypothetical protein